VITLRPPTLAECQLVREWRNDPAVLPMLRTGYKTEAEQAAFYRDVVCNHGADHRYYALVEPGMLTHDRRRDEVRRLCVGMGGLTYLSRVTGEAEISLIVGDGFRGKGYGREAVGALLREAERIDLRAVIGECLPTGHVAFWTAMYERRWPGWLATSAGIDADGVFRWRWERTAWL
jgi:RimJ/RimL family protein N-acetyltransferase